MEPGNLVTAIVWAALPAVAVLSAIWWLDRYEREPIRLVGIALGIGALAAPILAVLVEGLFDVRSSMTGQGLVPESELGIATPMIEEIVRGLAVLGVMLLVRHEIDTLLDGVVYGAVIGTGFGLTANFVSILSTPALEGDTTPSLFFAAVAGMNHAFYGAVIGLVVAAARGWPQGMALGAALGIVAAAGFHALHDYLPWWAASPADDVTSNALGALLADVPNLLGMLALGVIAVWTTGREKVILARELREEVDNGVVSPRDYATVTRPLRRVWILTATLFGNGDDAWRLHRQLYALETDLAFRKYHRAQNVSRGTRLVDEDVYRRRIGETRSRLAELVPEATPREGVLTPPPRNTVVSGLGGLAGFALLAIVLLALWFFALRPEPVQASGAPPTIAAAAATDARLLAAVRLAAPAAGAGFTVQFCRSLRRTQCVRPYTFNRRGVAVIPRASRQFVFVVRVRNAKRNDKLEILWLNVKTQQAAADSDVFKLRRASTTLSVRFEGPFPKMAVLVGIFHNGSLIDFDPPIVFQLA